MLWQPSTSLYIPPSPPLLPYLSLDEWEMGTKPWHKDPEWTPGSSYWCPSFDTTKACRELGITYNCSPVGVVSHRRALTPGGVTSGTLVGSLAAAYELEEASGTRVDALGVTNLTTHGTVNNASGKVGNCAVFANNSSNYLSADGTKTALNEAVNRQCEMSGWFWMTTKITQTHLAENTVANSANLFISFQSYFHFWRIFVRNVQIDCSTFGNNPAVNTWVLIHIYDDGTNAGVLFNNGSGQTATRAAGAASTCNGLFVGKESGGNPTNGQVDQVFLWIGRSLTSNERSYMYNSGSGRSYAQVSIASP